MDDTHIDECGRRGGNDLTVERPIADLLMWLLEIPDDGRNSSLVCRSKNLRVFHLNLVALKSVQVLVSKVGWLANSLPVQQSEPAVERSRRGPFEWYGFCLPAGRTR